MQSTLTPPESKKIYDINSSISKFQKLLVFKTKNSTITIISFEKAKEQKENMNMNSLTCDTEKASKRKFLDFNSEKTVKQYDLIKKKRKMKVIDYFPINKLIDSEDENIKENLEEIEKIISFFLDIENNENNMLENILNNTKKETELIYFLEEFKKKQNNIVLEKLKELEEKLGFNSTINEFSINEKIKSIESMKNFLINEIRKIYNNKKAILISNKNTPVLINNRYFLLKIIGKGGFSEVYKAIDLEKRCFVAIKLIFLEENLDFSKKLESICLIKNEFLLQKGLNHTNILPLYDFFQYEENKYISVLKYCKDGDLNSYMQRENYIAEEKMKSLFKQIAKGLQYLHIEQNIIHYDLKPHNIFLEGEKVFIGDFGLSRRMKSNLLEIAIENNNKFGTFYYLPPECHKEELIISKKVDIWSFGITLYELYLRKKPFDKNQLILKNFDLNNWEILLENTLVDNTNIPKEAQQIIKSCLVYDPRNRISTTKLLEFSFFN